MSFRLLIDECLSPSLARVARERGHPHSTCVRDLGWSGIKDWDLVRRAVAGDYTIVTHNAADFRGTDPPFPGGLMAKEAVHAGLVCLSTALPMDLARQHALFAYALAELDEVPDLVNLCLEIVEREDGQVSAVCYELPPS